MDLLFNSFEFHHPLFLKSFVITIDLIRMTTYNMKTIHKNQSSHYFINSHNPFNNNNVIQDWPLIVYSLLSPSVVITFTPETFPFWHPALIISTSLIYPFIFITVIGALLHYCLQLFKFLTYSFKSLHNSFFAYALSSGSMFKNKLLSESKPKHYSFNNLTYERPILLLVKGNSNLCSFFNNFLPEIFVYVSRKEFYLWLSNYSIYLSILMSCEMAYWCYNKSSHYLI
jgi:hypothetical protein